MVLEEATNDLRFGLAMLSAMRGAELMVSGNVRRISRETIAVELERANLRPAH